MIATQQTVLAETLCDELKLTRPDAKEMVEEFYETLRHALENGQHVKLSGFG
ncbi:HU family DNA-binding protein, partial [Legionella sp. 28fT52]|uniref:HU family DNA-binding protein n=1 Tax=Legionella sp. 28fT52 TaxID=3410134 RepID=UPI003AF5E093